MLVPCCLKRPSTLLARARAPSLASTSPGPLLALQPRHWPPLAVLDRSITHTRPCTLLTGRTRPCSDVQRFDEHLAGESSPPSLRADQSPLALSRHLQPRPTSLYPESHACPSLASFICRPQTPPRRWSLRARRGRDLSSHPALRPGYLSAPVCYKDTAPASILVSFSLDMLAARARHTPATTSWQFILRPSVKRDRDLPPLHLHSPPPSQ
jgi:hypothetical protein